MQIKFPAPQFAGMPEHQKPVRRLEIRLNAMTRTTDQFERLDGLQEKISPWLDKLLAPFPQRRIRKAIRSAQQNLEQVLDQLGYSRQGGLDGPYWQAYHLPRKMLLAALGSQKPDRESLKEYARFIEESYIPLLNYERDFANLHWLLEGVADCFNPDRPRENLTLMRQVSQNLTTLNRQNPHLFQLLQGAVAETARQLKAAFYTGATRMITAEGDVMEPLPARRRQAYLAERAAMITAVILPWLEATGSLPPVLFPDNRQTPLDTALEVLSQSRTSRQPPSLILSKDRTCRGEEAYFQAWQHDMLALLWRMTVMHCDLNSQPLDSSGIRKALEALQPHGNSPSLDDRDDPIYIAHDDVFNVIPAPIWERSGKSR